MPTPVVKAHFVGERSANADASNVKPIDHQDQKTSAWDKVQALVPPYDPWDLAAIVEASASLGKNIESYVTNIHGFGHRFVPVIDLDADDVDEQIKDAIRVETNGLFNLDPDQEPTDEEVKSRKEKLRKAIRVERTFLELYFDRCSVTLPFCGVEGLRGRTGKDMESLGFAFWEVLRNGRNKPTQFNHVHAPTVRLLPLDETPVEVDVPVRDSAISTGKTKAYKQFRRYVQRLEKTSKITYFKEFGDPRIVSSVTGKNYEDIKALRKEEPGANPATEIIEFKIYNVRSAYGVPRWIGTLASVLGSRESDEVNLLYFKNKSIPPMAILVSGGHLTTDTITRLEDYIKDNLVGKDNFWRTMILEAESPDASAEGKIKIELKPLKDAQQQDALFLEYDKANDSKIGQSFRLPKILRGDVGEISQSIAEAAIDFAELQVFGPLRESFDNIVNRQILPELGITHHMYVSNAPAVRDPKGLSKILTELSHEGIITPGEARDHASGVFGQSLPKIKAYWTEQPLVLTTAGRGIGDNKVTPGDEASEFATPDGKPDFSGQGPSAAAPNAAQAAGAPASTAGTIKQLIAAKAELEALERDAVAKAFTGDSEPVVIKIPNEILRTFVVPK